MGSPELDRLMVFSEGVGVCLKCCVAILGIFHREDVWEEAKKVDLDAETAPYLGLKQQPLAASRCAPLDPYSHRRFIFQLFVGVRKVSLFPFIMTTL